MNYILALILSINTATPVDTSAIDNTYVMPDITIVSTLKQQGPLFEQPIAGTSFSLSKIERQRILEAKDLSLATPNLYLPDYGSKMTSSIYVRGIGARMDQPSMGLYVDNIPVLNKNNYDFDFYDIRRIDVLRGPQGTLYGRNTIGGVINIYTLSPFEFTGTRASVSYGNRNTAAVKISHYRTFGDKVGFSVAAAHNSSNGFYTNVYNGEKCDKILTEGLRMRLQWHIIDRLTLDYIITGNYVKQDGFAYSLYDEETGRPQPINHNDPSHYRRSGVTNGLILKYTTDKILLSSATGYNLTDDKMTLDQDFTPRSMFTLVQAQKEYSFTQEFLARSNGPGKYQWLFGAFGFYRKNKMDAPVTFKRDGIDQLILGNANANMQAAIPNAELLIFEDEFEISSEFELPGYGGALFHQSSFETGRWKLTAGVRLDYEHAAMDYYNFTMLNFRLNLTMPDYQGLSSHMIGSQSMSFSEVLPRFSGMYKFDKGNIFAVAARGYKAGGYNTQIFSDILQNGVMNEMFDFFGIKFPDDPGELFNSASATSYKPEYSWNYEVGTHLNLLSNSLTAEASVFYIDCRDQQLTVFPPGKGTGRYMSNAGRTRSYGAEVALKYVVGKFGLDASYGYTNAKFIRFHDGNNDYKGNYVPYAPRNTIYAGAEYNMAFPSASWLDAMSVRVDWRGAGKIYWNEDNSLEQDFYGLLGARVSFRKNRLIFDIWGRNLLDSDYNTFYFKSIGNSFVQRGKPVQFGATLNLTI